MDGESVALRNVRGRMRNSELVCTKIESVGVELAPPILNAHES